MTIILKETQSINELLTLLTQVFKKRLYVYKVIFEFFDNKPFLYTLKQHLNYIVNVIKDRG